MDFSFIVVNHNSENFLEKCLDSIRKNVSAFSYEIIVVQNDGKHCFMNNESDIFQISLPENRGFGSACNAGAKKAAGRILFFLNPDTQFLTNNLALISNCLANKEIAIAAPQLFTKDGAPQKWGYGNKITPWSIIRSKIFFKKINSFPIAEDKKEIMVDWVSGAAIAITKDTFMSVGCFDENFFMYYEDVDLCHRLRSCGKKIVVLPELQVRHVGGQSYAEGHTQKSDYYTSQDYYLKKNFCCVSATMMGLLRRVAVFIGN